MRGDEQNTEIDLVGRAQEVAIDADRDHVAIATGNHPTQKKFKSGYSFIITLFSYLLIIILDPHRRTDHLADPEARSIPSRDPWRHQFDDVISKLLLTDSFFKNL